MAREKSPTCWENVSVPVGIVLVHGYSGSPDDLRPLEQEMTAVYGVDSVDLLCLPGHGHGQTPPFDQAAFIDAIAAALTRYKHENRTIICLGHSTGGILLLAALTAYSITPDLLVLASAPKKIDLDYLERWSRHRSGRDEISFASVAGMVSLINAVGARKDAGVFPALILHGSDDNLVPCNEAFAWAQNGSKPAARTVIVPSAQHDLFRGTTNALAIDLVMRAIADRLHDSSPENESTLEVLSSVEPEIDRFLAFSPTSRRHIASCPSALSAAERPIALRPVVDRDPVLANIEITTRCNLRCTYCARTISGRQGSDMDSGLFRSILGMLPHAYRITLVGLGETLLHPKVVDFVAEASSQGRRTALVTNAMFLDAPMSRELLKAGLDSIAFSIDGPNQDIASDVRPGTDLGRVIDNIRNFVELSKSSRAVSTAVFSAVSIRTLPYLEELLNLVSRLDVHVIMLTDLNLTENEEQTLWKNADAGVAAVVRRSIAKAFKQSLPVLSVSGLEEFGLWKRYGKYLLMPPDRLYHRSAKHAWCFSPWQTLPVGVSGEVTLCDCRPGVSIGNILDRPLADIWNGPAMVEHRRSMLGADPPEACRVCPRF